jgi:C4-dicarboxylate transporter DctQ subunit
MDQLERIDETIDRIETVLIVVFLSSMMILAFLQIFLRNVFTTGLAWGDTLLRNLVLWIGFIGATLATREGKHIHLFSLLICGLLTYASLKFIRNEMQMGTPTLLGIPIWILEAILPLTFGLMAFRFALRSIKSASLSLNGVKTPDPGRDE